MPMLENKRGDERMSDKSMIVRRAKSEDARGIKSAHYWAYQKCFKGYLPDDFLKAMPFDEDTIQRTAEYIKTHEYYVAEKDKQILGFTALQYPEEKTVEVLSLYVHPDVQRQGVGTALMNEVCRISKERGYTKLILWTIKDGPSIGFYQKQGLQSSNMEKKFYKCDVPIVRYEKSL